MIYVMQIVNTHGIRGEVKALHFTDGEAFFKKVKTVYKKDGTPVKILSWRFQKGAVLLKLEGVDDVNTAERLKFTELYAKEEDLPKLFEEYDNIQGQANKLNAKDSTTSFLPVQ